MLLQGKGIIHFEPELRTKKQVRQSDWKSTAVIEIQGNIHEYYAWFLKKRFNLELNKLVRGSHITFISDRLADCNIEEYKKIKEHFQGKEISFLYDVEDVCTNGKHWWLRVYSPEALSIREIAGFPRDPFFGLHMTLGYANEKFALHSEYIFSTIKFHNLYELKPRLEL